MKRVSLLILGVLLVFTPVFLVTVQAAKPTIGVVEFKNTSGAGWWHGGMGWELAGMVANELASNGDFKVVERQKLESVLREQDLAVSGRVAKGTAAKLGRLTGAKYLVFGTVTSYQESTSGTGGGISIGGFSIGGKKEKAYIAVDLRVVDTTTGEIAYARSIEANSSAGGLRFGLHVGGVGGNLGKFNKTPAGKAVRACVIEIVDYLDCAMVKRDSCLAEFKAKEERRKAKTKRAITLDE